jgi:hypothetical protein
MDGEGIREIIFTSGAVHSAAEKAISATVTVCRYYATSLAWGGSHYKPYKWVETKKKFKEEQTALHALLDPSAVIVRAGPRPDEE